MQQVLNTIERLDAKFPFFVSILNKLDIKEDHRLPVAGTNGVSLIVNYKVYSGLPNKMQEFALLHEAAHIALKHPLLEVEDLNRVGLNLAADYQVNSFLYQVAEEVGESLEVIPGITLYDSHYDDMGFEDVYHALRNEGVFDENSCSILAIPDEHPDDEIKPLESELNQMIAEAADLAEKRGLLTSSIQFKSKLF